MKKLFLSLVVMTALCVGFVSCGDEDNENTGVENGSKIDVGNGNGNTSNSIVGRWVSADGETGMLTTDLAYWEFTADGQMFTNTDAAHTSTYEYDSTTKKLYLWGGVRVTTVTWISSSEIKGNIIGHLKKL